MGPQPRRLTWRKPRRNHAAKMKPSLRSCRQTSQLGFGLALRVQPGRGASCTPSVRCRARWPMPLGLTLPLTADLADVLQGGGDGLDEVGGLDGGRHVGQGGNGRCAIIPNAAEQSSLGPERSPQARWALLGAALGIGCFRRGVAAPFGRQFSLDLLSKPLVHFPDDAVHPFARTRRLGSGASAIRQPSLFRISHRASWLHAGRAAVGQRAAPRDCLPPG